MAASDFNTLASDLFGNSSNGMAVLNLVSNNMIPTIRATGDVEDIKASSIAAKRRKRVSFADKSTRQQTHFSVSSDLMTAVFTDDVTDIGWDPNTNMASLQQIADAESALNTSTNSTKKQPNILKKKDQPGNDPIKNLPFSPSRFLNDAATSFTGVGSISKDLNTSFTAHADDSGIENASCDTYGMFTTPSLTSTPICKSRRKFSTPSRITHDICSPLKNPCSIVISSSSDIIDFTADQDKSAAHFDSGNETVLKTPLIRRYLNESVPCTPTPFKCGTNASKSETGCISIRGLSSIDTAYYSEESSVLGVKDDHSDSQYGYGRSTRKARKALMLDQDWPILNSGRNEGMCRDDMPLATRLHDSHKAEQLCFIPFGSPPKCRLRSPSGLIDGGTIVRQRSFNSGKKSCFYTLRPDTTGTFKMDEESVKWKASMELNKKWVSIACGRSEDQKAMTNAAKRYLSQYKCTSSKETLTQAVLKRKAVYGNSIR